MVITHNREANTTPVVVSVTSYSSLPMVVAISLLSDQGFCQGAVNLTLVSLGPRVRIGYPHPHPHPRPMGWNGMGWDGG